jgi:hypothetical protein
MTGSLLNPTKADFSPEGVLPHKGTLHPRKKVRTSAVVRPLAPPTRLKRLIHGWMAAANAYRERQSALLAHHRACGRKLNNKRVYRGPIDDALEKAARLRQRRRRKPSLN